MFNVRSIARCWLYRGRDVGWQMVGVSMKTLSNYINHLTGPPIE